MLEDKKPKPMDDFRHSSFEAHRMGMTIPFGEEPQPNVPGFSYVGTVGTPPASSDHSHSSEILVGTGSPDDSLFQDPNPGITFLDDDSKTLWIRYNDGWYPVGGQSGSIRYNYYYDSATDTWDTPVEVWRFEQGVSMPIDTVTGYGPYLECQQSGIYDCQVQILASEDIVSAEASADHISSPISSGQSVQANPLTAVREINFAIEVALMEEDNVLGRPWRFTAYANTSWSVDWYMGLSIQMHWVCPASGMTSSQGG
jgi:hypothetical protein